MNKKKIIKWMVAPAFALSLTFTTAIPQSFAHEITADHAYKKVDYQNDLNKYAAHVKPRLKTIENLFGEFLNGDLTDKQVNVLINSILKEITYYQNESKNYNIKTAHVKEIGNLVDKEMLELKTYTEALKKTMAGEMTDDELLNALTTFITNMEKLDSSLTSKTNKLVKEHGVTLNSDMKYILTGEDEMITYTVKKGDTLYSIGKKYGITVDELMLVNGLESGKIHAGQKLIVNFDVNEPNTYTVQKGDTLYNISKSKHVSVTKLKQLNHLKKNEIYPGQKLKLK
jgi:LysM repeat protein